MKRRPSLTHLELLTLRSAEHRRELLAGQYRDLAHEAAELLPLALSADPPAPRLTRHLGTLEAVAGRQAPADVLPAWDVTSCALRKM